MSYPPNQPPPGPGWGQDQGGWAPQPGPEQGWAPPPGQAPPPGPQQQWSQPGYGTPPPGMPGGAPAPKGSSPVLPIAIIVVLIAAAAGAFFVFASGDDDGGDPEAVATSYVNALIDRDCDAMGDIVNLEGQGATPAELLAECQAAVEASGEASEFLPTELVSTRVVSEEGDSATVAAEVRLGSGDTTTQDLDMVRVDGDWRINVDPFGGGEGPPTSETIPPPDDDPDDSPTTTEDEPDSTTTTSGSTGTTFEEGTDAEDAANRDACAAGDMAACDDLWRGTPVGSDLEAFAETCGGRDPAGGHSADCESTFG